MFFHHKTPSRSRSNDFSLLAQTELTDSLKAVLEALDGDMDDEIMPVDTAMRSGCSGLVRTTSYSSSSRHRRNLNGRQ